MPVLSIQPLIENAVKHGVGMKEDGGAVTLSTYMDGSSVIVKVTDDGVGFDISKPFAGEGHIGISSSTERLKLICNAETEIKSTDEKGTEITILIPS